MFQNIERKIEKIGFEKVAVFFILFFGICLRIVAPPYQVLDEMNHFGRAWQISEGIFFGESEEIRKVERGDNPTTNRLFKFVTQANELNLYSEDEKFLTAEIPRSMIPTEFQLVNMKLTAENWKIVAFENVDLISWKNIEKFLFAPLNLETTEILMIPNTGQYPPLAYFPQATVAFIGRNLNLSAGAIYYAMCFASLFFVAICVFWAMKILPEKKFLIFLIASIPMFILESVSISADAVTYGVCILGSAWLLSQRNNFSAITYKEIFLLIVLSICLGLLKSVYGTILILYFLMSRQRFKNTLHFVGFGIFLLALNLFTSTIWLHSILNFNDVDILTSYCIGFASDIALQKNFLSENPAQFVTIFANTILTSDAWHPTWFFGLFGLVLELPETFCIVYFLFLIFIASTGKLELKIFQRSLIFFSMFVTFFGIFLAEYLFWTPVGADIILGIQGRYFIPIALSTFCMLSSFKAPKFVSLIVLIFGFFSTIFTTWLIFSKFFT